MTIDKIQIQNVAIGKHHPPFIVAEMSGNHNQSLDRALKLVEAAAQAGVQGLKLQTYTADTITLDVESNDFVISDPQSLWHGKSLHQLYHEAHTPWEWHEPIFERCRQLGLIGFSSPFDESAVDFLENLNVPCYKIASFENSHLPLIEKVARTGKPMIISTGTSTLSELDEAVHTAQKAGCQDLILLKCTSTYPANPENSNLLTIPHLRDLFNVQVGLSDHTMGIGVAIASTAVGATFIEKHLTLRRAEGGVDSAFSMEPHELQQLVIETKRAWQSLGHIQYGLVAAEEKSRMFRRSLFIAQDMKAGDIFTPENLRVVRPSTGLHPRYYEELLGKAINQDAAKGTPMTWSMMS
ncbi:MAG: pseudaminic acid synthase [Elainellaceae cyanobacterium]